MVEARRGRRSLIDDLDLVPLLDQVVDQQAEGGNALVEAPIRRDAQVHGQHRLVRHHIAGHASLDEHGLRGFPVLAAVDHGLARLVGLDGSEDPSHPVDGVAPHPGPGRVGPLATERDPQARRALAAGLDRTVGRFAQDGGIAGQQLGPLLQELE